MTRAGYKLERFEVKNSLTLKKKINNNWEHEKWKYWQNLHPAVLGITEKESKWSRLQTYEQGLPRLEVHSLDYKHKQCLPRLAIHIL